MIFPKELIGDFYPLEKSKSNKRVFEVPINKFFFIMEKEHENLYDKYKMLEKKYAKIKKSHFILLLYCIVSTIIMLYNTLM